MTLLLRFVVLLGLTAALGAFPACKQENTPAPQPGPKKSADNTPKDDFKVDDDFDDPCESDDYEEDDYEEDYEEDDEEDYEEEEDDEFLLTGKAKKKNKKAKSLKGAKKTKKAKKVKKASKGKKASKPKVDTRGFALLATPSYDGEIKSILQSDCGACHSGVTPPDISSYSKAKANADAIYDSVAAGRMPPGNKLSQSKIDKIKAWVDAGAPQSSSDDEGDEEEEDEEEEEEDDTSSSADCADDEEEEEDDDDDDSDSVGVELDWDEVLNPKELKKCHDKGYVYDRKAQACHKAKLATSYECDRNGIVNAFKGINIGAELDKSKSEGYEIDQCGEYEGDPVVFLYKKKETTDSIGLDIRKYCKENSPACQ